MRKLFTTIIILFVFYLGIQFAFHYFGKGNDWDYQIKKGNITFDIAETSSLKLKDNLDNYYFKITTPNRLFTFQTYYNFGRASHVIEDIEYYQDDVIECLLPVFKDTKILLDMMCYYNDSFVYYRNIKGENSALDSFIKGIANYDIAQFTDSATIDNFRNVSVYKDNLIKGHYIGLTNYTGIFNISKNFNSTVYQIDLYKSDIYSQKIGAYVNEFYISADYDSQYEFNKFNVIDLVQLDTSTIVSNTTISFDSYIQGVVDGKVYLYDKDNKKQYEINPEKKTIVEVGSNGNIKHYQNGEWTTMTESEANNETVFENQIVDYTNGEYARIDKVGDATGYYYLYKKTDNGYQLYRKNIQDDTIFTLFATQTIDHIVYDDNYIYFIDGNTVKVYHDTFGIKNLITYSELEFNRNVNFNVYTG